MGRHGRGARPHPVKDTAQMTRLPSSGAVFDNSNSTTSRTRDARRPALTACSKMPKKATAQKRRRIATLKFS